MIKVQCVRSWYVHVTCSPHPMPYAVNTALVAHFRPDPRDSSYVFLKFLVHCFAAKKENHSHELKTYVSRTSAVPGDGKSMGPPRASPGPFLSLHKASPQASPDCASRASPESPPRRSDGIHGGAGLAGTEERARRRAGARVPSGHQTPQAGPQPCG